MTQKIVDRHVIVALPVLLVGGTEVQTLALIQVLRETGYRITVCCYHEFDTDVVAKFEQTGACVVLMRMQRSDRLLAVLLRLQRFFREEQPDIIHVQYLAPGLIPIIAARMAGIKTVFATIHIAGSVQYGRKAKFLLRIAGRLCTSFFCVSRGVEQFWFGDSIVLEPARIERGRRHFTIYNGVDIERIKDTVTTADSALLRRELGIPPESPVIGIVGRLAEQKGHTFLIEAFKEVVAQFPAAVLLVVGDGPLRQQLEEQARCLGFDRSVLWLGSKIQEEVFRLYTVMTIFAMPSLFEGFGLTAAEAMAAGLPVVATRADGLSEVVEDGVTGFLVDAGTSDSLARTLIQLLRDPNLCRAMGRSGQERVQGQFSMKQFETCLSSAYRFFART